MLLLGLLALALAGLVAAELAPRVGAPETVIAAPGRLPAAGATRAPAGRVARWVATILGRPLFSPSRRPPASEAAAGPGGLPRLAGVIVGPSGSTVIFASSGDKAPILAHEGGVVGSWRVQRISAGEVVLRGPEGVRVLHPAFAKPAQVGANPAAGPPIGQVASPTGPLPSLFQTHPPFPPTAGPPGRGAAAFRPGAAR